jgi:hypothetical protein
MEVTKVINKLKDVSLELEKSYTKDMMAIIENIYNNYDVKERGTDKLVSKGELISRFKLSEKNESMICLAMCQNGNKCVRRSMEGSEYCKMHIGLSIRNKISDVLMEVEVLDVGEGVMKVEGDIGIKNERFIEDMFYYVDERYIYDKETLEKVGVVSRGEYILTSDPFILERG